MKKRVPPRSSSKKRQLGATKKLIQARWVRAARIDRQVREAGLKHEPFKLGRYAEYYSHGKGIKPPFFFMSMEEESLRGSSSGGFISDWVAQKGIDSKTLDRRKPQIALIPRKELGKYLSSKLGDLSTEGRNHADTDPYLRKFLVSLTRNILTAIDWAEQTHKIRIDVDPKILAWIGKAN